jgi:hypothetical protein
MTTTTRPTLAQRSAALALAVSVTLALLGGIDRLATHEATTSAVLAHQQAVVTPQG